MSEIQFGGRELNATGGALIGDRRLDLVPGRAWRPPQ